MFCDGWLWQMPRSGRAPLRHQNASSCFIVDLSTHFKAVMHRVVFTHIHSFCAPRHDTIPVVSPNVVGICKSVQVHVMIMVVIVLQVR